MLGKLCEQFSLYRVGREPHYRFVLGRLFSQPLQVHLHVPHN